MTNTIWLIAESEEDVRIVQTLIRKRGFEVRVKWRQPPGNEQGISALAKHLESLIKLARSERKLDDCIAVLYDADIYDAPDQKHQKKILQICRRPENKDIARIVAEDEIESWLLADEELCKWLEAKPHAWDKKSGNKEELQRLLGLKKLKWQGSDRKKVLEHLDGTGDKYSPSMKNAVGRLENGPCTRVKK